MGGINSYNGISTGNQDFRSTNPIENTISGRIQTYRSYEEEYARAGNFENTLRFQCTPLKLLI